MLYSMYVVCLMSVNSEVGGASTRHDALRRKLIFKAYLVFDVKYFSDFRLAIWRKVFKLTVNNSIKDNSC